MSSTGWEIKQPTAADQYNFEAQQQYLRTLDGRGGTWVRHEPKTNLIDIIYGTNTKQGA